MVPQSQKEMLPKATEVIAKINHKVKKFFDKNKPQINGERSMQSLAEEKSKATQLIP